MKALEFARLTQAQKEAYRKEKREYARLYMARKRAEAKANEFSRAKERYQSRQRPDVLITGGALGKLVGAAKPLNGEFDTVLSYLRVQRIKAEDSITALDKAITAIEGVKPARHA